MQPTHAGWTERRIRLLRDLAQILIRTSALKFGTFTLTSGRLSTYYVDLRMVPSFPGAFRQAVEAYSEIIRWRIGLDRVDAIGGIPTSGLTYASSLAYYLQKPLIYARLNQRSHGTTRQIEGVLKPDWKVVIIDDLVSSGGSLLRAAEIIRGEGASVEEAAVLLDRMEGGPELLASSGVRVNCIGTIMDMVEELSALELVTPEQKQAVRGQIESIRLQTASLRPNIS